MKLNKIHHIAMIVSDYEKSKKFYTEQLGFQILRERILVRTEEIINWI